jgi:hypothetical protein
MLRLIVLVVVAAWGLFALNVYRRLRRHIAQAKATGLPYLIVRKFKNRFAGIFGKSSTN